MSRPLSPAAQLGVSSPSLHARVADDAVSNSGITARSEPNALPSSAPAGLEAAAGESPATPPAQNELDPEKALHEKRRYRQLIERLAKSAAEFGEDSEPMPPQGDHWSNRCNVSSPSPSPSPSPSVSSGSLEPEHESAEAEEGTYDLEPGATQDDRAAGAPEEAAATPSETRPTEGSSSLEKLVDANSNADTNANAERTRLTSGGDEQLAPRVATKKHSLSQGSQTPHNELTDRGVSPTEATQAQASSSASTEAPTGPQPPAAAAGGGEYYVMSERLPSEAGNLFAVRIVPYSQLPNLVAIHAPAADSAHEADAEADAEAVAEASSPADANPASSLCAVLLLYDCLSHHIITWLT